MLKKITLSPNQDIAANPAENIWVQANAGTGKTGVLVQRLLRILFRRDADAPCGILCLTYTNAGAGEMRNRILKMLRGWAMMPDNELRDFLDGIPHNKIPTDTDLAYARQIFFEYIDNPDMLKIKTIHGFCEEILRQFPLEAGISPSWSLVSDAPQRVLLQDAFERLIKCDNNPVVTDAFAHIVGRVSEYAVGDLLENLSKQYKCFFNVADIVKYREYFIDTTRKFLELELPIVVDVAPEKLEKIIEIAQSEINRAKKPAEYLTRVVSLTRQYIDKTIDFEEYKTAYLTKDDTRRQHVSKKDYLQDELERVFAVVQYNANKQVFDDTLALFDLASAFATVYRELKSARNLLDFEDLVLYTGRLFSNPETMGWVLSQLNIRLSHILVDEAQDTAPAQWDILRMLAGDFFTDGDTANRGRSLFVVGDTKQSIYGFQGADPRAFAASRDEIATQIRQNMRTIREVPLTQSFRSLPAVLNAVDAFFTDADVVAQTGFVNNKHAHFNQPADGLVLVHKLTSKTTNGIDVADYVRGVADDIDGMIKCGECAASEIMVLVQNRRPFAPLLETELKRRGIDVAGSDRIILPEFAVLRDLMNLVRFCLSRSDDFSLCCVLKSPMFRLSELDIYKICEIKNLQNHARRASNPDAVPITVFDVLRDEMPDIYAVLSDMVSWSATLAPYSFFTRVLNANGIRDSFVAALGEQIVDPLEEFMTICLAYERTQSGTMRHFLKWFITGASEVKRDLNATSGVRIATVHGSKGLESRVIFLIDTVRTPKTEHILPLTDGVNPDMPPVWLWAPRKDHSARRAVASDDLNNVRIAEYYRLLYVAMTRARNQLHIYGFTADKNAPEISWHAMLWRVLCAATGTPDTNDTIRITDDTKFA